ncbi:hypothetical protein GJT88_02120 [Enterobacteriaceae endosymbiont of Donacia tomentosa]|uniref:exodeoxyribonuclease V subunit gamma n=1 Tax=Enterobacteriaceae endosymbiont of Donacia tomentosa TaxID=2675787 RepID=UPI001449363F|nr:exodeoxyribonuclease V subunit gamma [Enterobacteriaceae endosymbiont of Donacia tomentosa]QJC31830.1 hypothetical protein GJT88_02120 [Enterobacteriaceae endosymbiont of Donacia tomentosa]
MFTIYNSNNIDILLNLIKIQITKKPLTNPLEPEIIIYNNNHYAQLMKINFSNILGIYANINFISFEEFIRNLFIKIIPDIYQDDFLYRESIIWKIMYIIPKLISNIDFINFKKYFSHNIKNINFLFQISDQIYHLYDKYQKYKPELLLFWEKNKMIPSLNNEHQIWQTVLWQNLIKYNKKKLGKQLWHYGKLYNFYQKNDKYKKFRYHLIPERIFILDIQNIPPIFLKLLRKIEKYMEIHLLMFTPCKYYWGNLENNNFNKKNQNYLFYNSLLLSWGKYHLNNINKLINIPSRTIESFVKNDPSSLLNNIKNDILYLNNNLKKSNTKKYKKKINISDNSIAINICENIKVEVSILYNNILKILENNPKYLLHDIIVLSPNLELYIPFIHATFSDINLPINLNMGKIPDLDLLDRLIFLLKLPYKDFTPDEIFFLLENEQISKRFHLNKQDLECLRFWVKNLGIKYGLNFKYFNKIIIPKDQYTWKFGLHRLFLGYAINSISGSWNNIIPYNGGSIITGKLLEKFTNFLFKLEEWKKKLNKKYFLEKWENILLKIYSDFFIRNISLNTNIYFVMKKIIFFIKNGLKEKYKRKIPVDFILEEFNSQIKKMNKKVIFNINKINFCALNFFKNSSFKVIFIIGMNNEFFPKISYPIVFDLMQNYPYKEGSNYLDESKNLFLKLIMSVEKKLYISYINNPIISSSKNDPSILINELLLYISNNYYINNKEKNNCIIKNICKIYKSKKKLIFIKNKKKNNDVTNIFNLKLMKIKKIKINDLINFWKHPVKGFFNQKLKIYLHDLNNIKLFDTEPFFINALQEFLINKEILYSLILNKDLNNLYNFFLNKGTLPYGYYGEIWWEEKIKKMKELFNQEYQKYKYLEIINKINFKISDITLFGTIRYFKYNYGLIKFEPKLIDIKTIIALWIEHLILCANNIYNDKLNFFVFGLKNTKYGFQFFSKKQAIFLLKQYIDGYIYGMYSPLMLPMKSSWSWINTCYNFNKKCIDNDIVIQKQAKRKFFYYWNNNNFPGECNDLYFERLNFNLDEKIWLKTILLIKKWILNLVYYIY